MNQIFSFKRFGMLFKKHTVENFKGYLMSMFVLVGILTVTIAILVHNQSIPMKINEQITLFIFFMLASGTIFTSNIFINLGDKRKAIPTLILPATTLEKFLVSWLYSFVIFQILFVAIYYIVIVTVLKTNNWHGQKVEIMGLFSIEQKILYLIYAVLHSIVLYGAIYFKKMHFIKTAFAFFITAITVFTLNAQALKLMINRPISPGSPFNGFSFPLKKNTSWSSDFADISLGEGTYKWVVITFLLITVIFWFAAYFRLKEKQV